MDLCSTLIVKKLFKNTGIRPLKKLGQNFLISKTVLNKIIKAADLKKTDIVLEIGPGIGALTKELAKKAGKVIAIEKDIKMIEILKKTLKDFNNIEIIHADILKFNLDAKNLDARRYKVVSNLPYYITSPVIKKFLECDNPPTQMLLMVQKEVAQRICAKPPRMNLLAVSVQFYSQPKIISYVSKNCFWPRPKIDSAIIKIVQRYSAYGSALFSERFFKIVKAGFAHPRKQLVNNLSNGLELEKPLAKKWLLKNNIHPTQRAQTLYSKDWLKLAKTFKKSII